MQYLGATYSCSNKLQKAILAYITDKERLIIDHSTVDHFKKTVVATIEGICNEHPRCTRVKPSWETSDKTDYYLYFGGQSIGQLNLFASK